MKVFIEKWGSSAAVRIPKSVMAAAHIELDQAVDVRVKQGRIIIDPVRRKVFKLDALLRGITLKNQHQRVDTGAAVGTEIW